MGLIVAIGEDILARHVGPQLWLVSSLVPGHALATPRATIAKEQDTATGSGSVTFLQLRSRSSRVVRSITALRSAEGDGPSKPQAKASTSRMETSIVVELSPTLRAQLLERSS